MTDRDWTPADVSLVNARCEASPSLGAYAPLGDLYRLAAASRRATAARIVARLRERAAEARERGHFATAGSLPIVADRIAAEEGIE